MKLNRRNVLLIVSGTIVLGTAIGIMATRHRKKKEIKKINDILDGNIPDPTQGGTVIISQSDYDKLPAGVFPLNVGDKNKKVYDVQKTLNTKYGTNLDLDGKYGESTYKAMCDNVWNTHWYTFEITECRDSLGARKSITQADYDTIKAHTSSTT